MFNIGSYIISERITDLKYSAFEIFFLFFFLNPRFEDIHSNPSQPFFKKKKIPIPIHNENFFFNFKLFRKITLRGDEKMRRGKKNYFYSINESKDFYRRRRTGKNLVSPVTNNMKRLQSLSADFKVKRRDKIISELKTSV